MSDLQMDYMLIKRERLDALLRVVEAARDATGLVSGLIEKWSLPAGDGRLPDAEQNMALDAWLDLRSVLAAMPSVDEVDDDE